MTDPFLVSHTLYVAESTGTQGDNFFERLFGIKPKNEIADTPTPESVTKIKLSPFAQQIADEKARNSGGFQVDVVKPITGDTEQVGIDAAKTNLQQRAQNFGYGNTQVGGAFGSGDPTGKVLDEPKNPL